jgi:hypothetical protein
MRCSSCKSDVTPVPPGTLAKLSLVGFYVASMLVSTVFSLLLGLNVILVPVAIAVGTSVGVAARRASSWTCPECKEEMAAPVFVPETTGRAAGTRPFVPQGATPVTV